jgi:hypothetical protein
MPGIIEMDLNPLASISLDLLTSDDLAEGSNTPK